MVLLALFGAVMGQGVVWYTGQFYAQSFIENVCKVNFEDSRNVLLIAILLATPFFVVFGMLSDKIGRKWIMLTGMLLAACSYHCIFGNLLELTNPAKRYAKIDASKSVRSEAVAYIDAREHNRILVSVQQDSVYTDGARFHYTFTDTLT